MANPTTATTYNVTLTSANTEYSQALPTNCQRFSIQARSADDIRFAFATGKVATPTAPYATIKAGAAYTEEEVTLAATTIYLASATAGVVVEIVAWA